MTRERCENCNGKGHVMDGSSAFLMTLTVVWIPVLFFDKNDKQGMSRKECEHCDGTGYIYFEDED